MSGSRLGPGKCGVRDQPIESRESPESIAINRITQPTLPPRALVSFLFHFICGCIIHSNGIPVESHRKDRTLGICAPFVSICLCPTAAAAHPPTHPPEQRPLGRPSVAPSVEPPPRFVLPALGMHFRLIELMQQERSACTPTANRDPPSRAKVKQTASGSTPRKRNPILPVGPLEYQQQASSPGCGEAPVLPIPVPSGVSGEPRNVWVWMKKKARYPQCDIGLNMPPRLEIWLFLPKGERHIVLQPSLSTGSGQSHCWLSACFGAM